MRHCSLLTLIYTLVVKQYPNQLAKQCTLRSLTKLMGAYLHVGVPAVTPFTTLVTSLAFPMLLTT